MERIRNRPLEIVLGLLLAAVLAGGVVLIWESFSGTFSDKITVSAQLAKAGDALDEGDIVTYRNVIIGEVTSSSGSADGSAVARLEVDPKQASQIPATVTAVAVPASLFGNTKIELLPSAQPGSARLHAGSVIAADRSPAAASLQTALANAYTLLTAIHPADLDAALSALADALDGQGSNINTLIAHADAYLIKLAPQLPQLNGVIRSLATVTQELARNAPDLLSALGSTLVVAKGILASKQTLAALLDVAPGTVDSAQRLLNPQNVANTVTVLQDEVPVSAALAENPAALIDTVDGFRAFANTFNGILSDGPYLKANLLLTDADFAQLVNTATGEKGNVFHGIVNPPEYTTADCPRYPGLAGPNCTGQGTSSATSRLLTTGTGYGGTIGPVGSSREQQVLGAAAHTITRLPTAGLSDATTDLLLGPVLRGTPTVVVPRR